MPQEIDLKVIDIIQRTYNVKSFRFKPAARVEYKAGQFLQATVLVDGKPESKYLSISSSPTEDFIEFTKKLTGSPFSNALDKMKKQDIVRLKLPMGNFNLNEQYKKIVFLSGGIGITPIRSMCKYATDKKLPVNIVLLYSNRTVKDIAFKEDFESMQAANKNLKVVHALSDEISSNCGPDARVGRIDKDMVAKEAPDYAERLFYTCGPPAMVKAMKCIVSEGLGLGPDKIKFENFSGY